MDKIESIINRLKLEPHPEGGFYKETYRSSGELNNLTDKYQGKRNFSTCIYFLLTSDAFSAFHRIKQDEIWHFYDGSPINLHQISPDGSYSNVIIGRDIEKGQQPQFVVQGGIWFAATVINKDDFSLVGCTVSPGFDFRDFEIANRNKLTIKYPEHENIITQLTRG